MSELSSVHHLNWSSWFKLNFYMRTHFKPRHTLTSGQVGVLSCMG